MSFNILIVDDSPAMRCVVRRVLEISGIDLGQQLEAAGGREALLALRSPALADTGLPGTALAATKATPAIDLIVTDINMPGMDGEEFLLQVRSDPRLAAIPVLVVSIDSTSARMQHMMALGADGYLAKPFLSATLRSEVHRLLAGGQHAGR